VLAEIENRLIEILQEKVKEVMPERITASPSADEGLPNVVVRNVKFKFSRAGLVENLEGERPQIEESLKADGTTKVFQLKETPLIKSVSVEYPAGTFLTEKEHYVVNYDNHSIIFLETPSKSKESIFVRYTSRKSLMTLKSLRIKALYSLEINSKDRSESDTLAEKVVRILLNAEDDFLIHGVEIKPLGGISTLSSVGSYKTQLNYLVEQEIHIEKTVEPMERIQITGKRSQKY
jgi:hypothetical protein